MDNLPKDPPDQNNNSVPPSFGSSFNPHSNPVDPNNPYQSQPPQVPASDYPNLPNTPNSPNIPENLDDPSKHTHYSEVAQHKPRDAQGHFLPYKHPTNPPHPLLLTIPHFYLLLLKLIKTLNLPARKTHLYLAFSLLILSLI